MYKVMASYSDDAKELPYCAKEDLLTEGEGWDWISDNRANEGNRHMWVELQTGEDEFFQGWDESETKDAWDGES